MRRALDDTLASYETTVVDIGWADGTVLRVRAAPEFVGEWPWPDPEPVHILTAWDPGPARPGPEVNRVREAALERDLTSLGYPLFSAVGVDATTARRDEGVAVRGAPEAEILDLGARYGQDAVFAWTPEEWAIVACETGRRLARGWSLQRLQP